MLGYIKENNSIAYINVRHKIQHGTHQNPSVRLHRAEQKASVRLLRAGQNHSVRHCAAEQKASVRHRAAEQKASVRLSVAEQRASVRHCSAEQKGSVRRSSAERSTGGGGAGSYLDVVVEAPARCSLLGRWLGRWFRENAGDEREKGRMPATRGRRGNGGVLGEGEGGDGGGLAAGEVLEVLEAKFFGRKGEAGWSGVLEGKSGVWGGGVGGGREQFR